MHDLESATLETPHCRLHQLRHRRLLAELHIQFANTAFLSETRHFGYSQGWRSTTSLPSGGSNFRLNQKYLGQEFLAIGSNKMLDSSDVDRYVHTR